VSARTAAAGLVVAVVLVLGLTGCGSARGGRDAVEHRDGPAASTSTGVGPATGTSGQDTGATATDVPATGVVIDQDDLDELGAALDDVAGTVDEVEAEMSQDPAP
jgi:hypothetical protein